MSDVIAPVARQFEACNRRDLPAFLACFAEDFRACRMPAEAPSLRGKAALSAFYAEHRFNRSALRAELIARTVLDSQAFDHERIHGLGEQPLESAAVFAVAAGQITTAWLCYAESA